MEPWIDIFVLVSGTFSIVATVPLIYLAARSVRDARDLRLIQYELAHLMRQAKDMNEEVRDLQHEIHSEQQAAKTGIDETKRTVERVTEAVEQVTESTAKRKRPLIRRILASEPTVR
jgi:peptidoglycan hydrolase CwlO-like protein